MKIRVQYVASGPRSTDEDPMDYMHCECRQNLVDEIRKALIDRVSWGIFLDREDVDALWAKIEELRGAAPDLTETLSATIAGRPD